MQIRKITWNSFETRAQAEMSPEECKHVHYAHNPTHTHIPRAERANTNKF